MKVVILAIIIVAICFLLLGVKVLLYAAGVFHPGIPIRPLSAAAE